MAKVNKKPSQNKRDQGQTFDDVLNKISESIKPGKKSTGATNLLIAAGAFAAGMVISKIMKPKGGLDGIDQKDKKVKIISHETLLDGGTQEWFLEVDGMQVRFDVDHHLESKTDGRIFVYNSSMGPKKLLELGGSGEFQIATILSRWLDQFWDHAQQAEMFEEEVVISESVASFPAIALSAAELLRRLNERRK